jgi:sulfite exporter TauE/SafE
MLHPVPACDAVSLSAAFVAGMAGSVHCLAMCGGLSAALGLRARRAPNAPRASLLAACHQAGRLTSYTLAGDIVGAFSGLLQGILDFDRMALIARMLAGLMLITISLGVLFHRRPLAIVERMGGSLWRRVAPLARSLPAAGIGSSLLLGMLWGWLPCGFIYSMLMFAALKGGAIQGAALMLCFGLGTVPAVFGASLISAQVGRVTMARGLNVAAGWLLLVFGALTMFGPWNYAHH